MALREIKTEKFDLLGKPWKGSIKFESSNETFFMALPREIIETTGERQASGKTLEELREDFDRVLKNHGELIATRRKIIAFAAKSKLKREEGFAGESRPGLSGIYGRVESIFEGLLEIKFAVGMEAKRGERKEYKDLNGSPFSQELIRFNGEPHYGTHVIDWTAEREAFFRSMIDSIEKAKAKMDRLFDHDETDTIVKLIDHAGGNLLGFEAKP